MELFVKRIGVVIGGYWVPRSSGNIMEAFEVGVVIDQGVPHSFAEKGRIRAVKVVRLGWPQVRMETGFTSGAGI